MALVKYLAIIFFLSTYFILYVWQNTEVMKLKMDLEKKSGVLRSQIYTNDRLRFRIAQLKSDDLIREYAKNNGYRRMRPGDFDVLYVMKNDETRQKK